MLAKFERRETARDAFRFLDRLPMVWNYGLRDQKDRREHSRRMALDALEAIESVNYGIDAVGGSGLAFLASQLELPEVDLIEPLASVTHARDIPIKTGGGYVQELSAWAANYSGAANNNLGIQENANLDIGTVQVDVQKGVWNARIWAQSMRVSFFDLQKLIDSKKFGIPAPYSLQQLLDDGLRLIWNKALDKIVYQGVGGDYGLMNNPAVTSVLAPATGSGSTSTWSTKTTTEILNDINYGILTCQQNSGYAVEGIPNKALVDYESWSLLNQPMTSAGTNSLLEYIYENNVALRQGVEFRIAPLPDPWIATAGTGSTNEILFYRQDEKSLYFKIPQPMQKVMTVPSVEQAGYLTLFGGCIGVVQWVRPTTALYLYGI